MKSFRYFAVVALFACLIGAGFAQTNPNLETGLKPYGSYHGGNIDSVSLTNGNLNVQVPIVSYPQRGDLQLGYQLVYNNKGWSVFRNCNQQTGDCTDRWIDTTVSGVQLVPTSGGGGSWKWMRSGNFSFPVYSYKTPDGGSHQMSGLPNGGLMTVDGTGYYYNGDTTGTAGLSLDRNGNQPYKDRNGNFITFDAYGNPTDTVGRTLTINNSTTADSTGCAGPLPIHYANIDSFPSPAGGTLTVKLCTATVSLSTSFGAVDEIEQPVAEMTGTKDMLQSVVIYNGTDWNTSQKWIFEYGDSYGDLTKITFPTGGTISYTYTSVQNCGIALTGMSRSVYTRTTNDGTTGDHTTTYNGPYVTDPEGNDTVHTISALNGCSYYETKTQYYQGHYNTGTLLKTVDTAYSWTPNPFDSYGDGSQTAISVYPTSVTTTWPDGTTSKVETQYDTNFTVTAAGQSYPGSFGNVIERREYDFGSGGSGPLLRKTDTSYLAFSNSAYLNANLLSAISSQIIYDGNGTQVASTSYGYDETALASSAVTTQRDTSLANPGVRGNRTSSSRWLNTTGGSITSHATYYDTGMQYQSIDPLSHTTTYSYSPAYAGSLPTQTCLPQTGSVAHCVSGAYDLNTGLLTTFTDQNSQSSTYHYDVFSRFTQADFPDGGQTTFAYPDNVTAQSTKQIDPTKSLTAYAYFDGFGRTKQTRVVDPEGDDFVDTIYDALGRVSTVSNPYRAGDSTYVTKTEYDGLGRTNKIIPTDGTESTNNTVTTYSANSVTVTDEAGKVRRSWTDGLGRLMEVDEPTEETTGGSPEIPATGSTGSVTISGSLQSMPDPGNPATSGSIALTHSGSEQSAQVQTQAATTASGSFTITGAEQRVAQSDCPIHQTCYLYDGGQVNLYVGAYSFYATYGQGSTTTSIANALRAAMSGNPTFTAGGTGNTVTITTITTGTAANYAISGSSYYDSGDFTHASFGVTPSGSNLTGGTNAVYSTIYDPGTVTVTANGFSKSTTYGQGSTISTVAAGLVSAFNGDSSSPVTASSSGATLTLTSKATGVSSNYTDSFSSATSDPAHFSTPSFAVSGGTTFSGGHDQGTLYDSGSITVTVGTASATVNYSGASTTPSSIASSLASILNSSSLVNATASGATINFTSKGTGASTNYSISSSGTFDTTHFSVASFSGPSGALSGGADDIPAVPPVGTGIWSLSNPSITKYTYDALDNLTCVEQHGGITGTGCAQNPSYDATSPWRVRRFTYDSLSRLLTSKNPESGTMTYVYNNDSILTSKTDARGVTITYSPTESPIDALHRLTKKTYSNGDSPVTYTYDTGANAIGRRSSMTDAVGTATWTYNSMGRELSELRTSNGISKSIGHSYNLDGSVSTVIYPSGAVLAYTVDSTGRPISVADTTNGINYVTSATYTPSGSQSSALYGVSGSFAGIAVNNSFNPRVQPLTISAVSPSLTILNLTYDYGVGIQDNGDVLQIINNRDNSRSQSFSYDGLNRLLTGQSSSSSVWANSYKYDPWGNLNKMLPLAGSSKPEGQHFDQTTNYLNQLVGYAYDAAGNLTTGGITYDAENRIASIAGVNYAYDGDGERVQKSNGTLYWGLGPLAESDLSGNITKEFVFFGDKRIAVRKSSGEINYLFSDILGSARVVTNATGTNLLDDQDFLPFGAIIPGGIAGSGNNYRFTGKEHDSESNNDYFGARFYSSTMGRWLTPDWSASPTTVPYADFSDPQTLNLYSYVRNSPTFRADKDGHWDYYQHDQITRMAYDRAKLAYNNNVNLANQRTDTGGLKFNHYGLGTGAAAHEQNYSPYAQRSHFLLSAGESQSTAYKHAISQFEANATVARNQLQAHANADSAIGSGLHQVQDAFAHTARDSNGQITHLQCYNCGSNSDHHHPDMVQANTDRLTPQAEGSVEASKDYLLLMNSAASMTDAQFASALKAFEDKYLAASDTVTNDNTPKEYKK